ncbi:glycosyltransferase family 2 protein [Alteromonas gracilis]|uniref:glycosyltransferase family 2 protein n=1 Tax=Alteromonas gracilis TaxID=1479524 RepID=UPI0030CC0EB4
MSFSPDVSITLTRYAEPNWLFLETLESLSQQKNIRAHVFVLDQQNNEEIRTFCQQHSSDSIYLDYQVIPAKSLSYARNEAICQCQTDLLFYIDTDAVAEPNWAQQLYVEMSKTQAAIAGGKIVPKWHKPPGLLQKSRFVLDQYSMLNLGETTFKVKKVIGANFAINKALLGDLAHFDEELGRQNGKLLGGEETQLCSDANDKGLDVIYVGSAAVQHQVMPERVSFKWISKRIYYGGYSRALRGGKPEPSNGGGKFDGWDYFALLLLMPFYVWGYLQAKMSKW